MVAPRRTPDAATLPIPETARLPDPEPKTPAELDARHRKVAKAIVAVAEMLVPPAKRR